MSRKDDLEKLIDIRSRRLQLLKEQQALHGANADPAVTIQIQEAEKDLMKLQAELAGLGHEAPATTSRRDDQYQTALHWAENGRRHSLTRFDLSERDLRLVDLDGANLRLANLSQANLYRASLREADLSLANLKGAVLNRAMLQGANLTEAKLIQANLSHADLSEANLSEADLRGADLSGATCDNKTKWPEGFNPQQAGARLVNEEPK